MKVALLVLALCATAARADDTAYAAFQLLIGQPVGDQLAKCIAPGPTENVPDGKSRSRFLDLREPPLPGWGDREAFIANRISAARRALEVVRRRASARYGIRAVLVAPAAPLSQLMPIAVRDGLPREGDVVVVATEREVQVAWSHVDESAVKDPAPPVATAAVPAGGDWVRAMDDLLGQLEEPRARWFEERDAKRGGTAATDLLPLAIGLALLGAVWPLLGRRDQPPST